MKPFVTENDYLGRLDDRISYDLKFTDWERGPGDKPIRLQIDNGTGFKLFRDFTWDELITKLMEPDAVPVEIDGGEMVFKIHGGEEKGNV